VKVLLWRCWWSYPDELRSLQGQEVLQAALRGLATNADFLTAIRRQQAGLDALQIQGWADDQSSDFTEKSDFHSLMSRSVASLSKVLPQVMQAEAARRMTLAAIALQRSKLAHGRYPASLSGLVPEFLAAVPSDPVDGRSLRYRLQTDGTFLLYSVGENGVDDGGNPAPTGAAEGAGVHWQSPSAPDWVWPRPAAVDEVKFTYNQGKAK